MSDRNLCEKCGKKMIQWPDYDVLLSHPSRRIILWKCGCGNKKVSHIEIEPIQSFQSKWEEENK